uniref:CC chemokine SCYA126 n=1 Tax=Ictalurus punctatus TaxID=7998 RepID=Q20IJ6_ICTPU|nr:CC chemokine SCYA126 [Ictalurus punctatus]
MSGTLKESNSCVLSLFNGLQYPGETPKCCLSTAPLSRRILKRVEKVTIQRSNGRCEIDALVLHIRGKRLCAPMGQWKLLEQLKSSLIGQQRF